MSKTVKVDSEGRVQLEDDRLPTAEEAKKILEDAGYDYNQVVEHGRIYAKLLFENLELKQKIAELEKQLAAKNG